MKKKVILLVLLSIGAGYIGDLKAYANENPYTRIEVDREDFKKLKFGQLHSHTNLSDGQGTVEEAFRYAKEEANLDFFAVTDHSNSFDNDLKSSMEDGSKSTKWKKGRDAANHANKDGEFTALYAYEMTWSGSTGGYGHLNTFNTEGFESRNNKKMDLKAYYEKLKVNERSITQFNHPGKTFGDFNDFSLYDSEIDKRISLIEVGNGEGAVLGSEYFRSYEYYDRALNKGWHLAPTNNQDNHKGKHGNSNTARTVILSDDLTRENVYDSLRDMRVYATEDNNLNIDYKVNGHEMGSILEDSDTVKIDVKFLDEDKGDTIDYIEIIGDNSKVIKKIKSGKEKDGFTFTLDNPNSTYYYLKVVQNDGHIAVTAPVWTKDRLNVGISKIEVDNKKPLQGESINIETPIYNNEEIELKNISVEYFINEAKEASYVDKIDKIAAGKIYKSKFTIKNVEPGNLKINARVKFSVNNEVKEFTEEVDLKVYKKGSLSKVLIDGGHLNQYVTGNYKGKISEIMNLVNKKARSKAVVTGEDDSITKEALEDVELLILTDPESSKNDGANLKPKKYSEEELNVIKEYSKAGGNILITSRADYKDAKGEYQNSVQGNSVLEAISAKVRFNDDQVVDNVDNGGQNYRLYFNNYNEESEYLKDVDKNKKYSFYSGCSVIVPEGLEKVDIPVRGGKDTANSDADKGGDYVAMEKGKVVPLAIESLENGGKVAIAGTTFFSDFELGGDYSNKKITENILDALVKEKELETEKIKNVRIDLDKDNRPDRDGEEVLIEGRVTAASNKSMPNNSFFDCVYIQDETVTNSL